MASERLECRACGAPLEEVFADLRSSPLSNAYLRREQLLGPEAFHPLKVFVCSDCLLVQLPESETPEVIFSDYAYFSSVSDSWLDHSRRYCDEMIERFDLGTSSRVIEVASNDGYLLQYFDARGIPVLGIEPAANVAEQAVARGIPTRVAFFGSDYAKELRAEGLQADLLLGNNVLAHVPDLGDFTEGLKIALAAEGVLTMEFPHLARLMAENQFDTIYHEHFSYFSFGVVREVFRRVGITLFDVEELPTHGGSLRIYGRHAEDETKPVTERVEALLERERQAGLDDLQSYLGFDDQVRETKRRLLEFLISVRRAGRSVVGYGAAAKGNTLLNYCGIGTDMVDYVVDRSPHKQGLHLPGSRIPIHPPERLAETRPDYVLILPWNLEEEITRQMSHIKEWGGRFCVAIPELRVLP